MVEIGKIVNTFGIRGELKVLTESEFVADRFKVGRFVYLENKQKLEISGFREHNGFVMIKVDHYENINDVEKYKGETLYMPADQLPKLDNDYYLFQLVNLDVYHQNEKIGTVIDAIKPAQTLLSIQLEDRVMMLPFVDAFIERVDLENNALHINLIEGL
ncbi:MAG: 16S rRNA processing protein RimM [Erysipelothrix sp.]|nr:16S rRNA processing protein RimM [Erysipelothrix sp.]